jgi:hypothetical protein
VQYQADAVLAADRQLLFDVNFAAGGGDGSAELGANPFDLGHVARRRFEHRSGRTKANHQRLPNPWPDAAGQTEPQLGLEVGGIQHLVRIGLAG